MNYKRKNELRKIWRNEKENKNRVREKIEVKRKNKTKVENRGENDE